MLSISNAFCVFVGDGLLGECEFFVQARPFFCVKTFGNFSVWFAEANECEESVGAIRGRGLPEG